MAFMVPEYVYGKWFVVETDHGTEIIPLDVVEADRRPEASIADVLKPYLEGKYESHEIRKCWGARLSAPGYLDCTVWMLFDTEEQARADIREMYDVDPDTGDDLTEEAEDG